MIETHLQQITNIEKLRSALHSLFRLVTSGTSVADRSDTEDRYEDKEVGAHSIASN